MRRHPKISARGRFLACLLGVLLASPAAARAAAPAPADSARKEIEALVQRLEDPAQRAALIRHLRLLFQESPAAPPAEPPPLPSINHLYARFVRSLDDTLTRSLRAFQRLPDRVAELSTQWRASLSEGATSGALARFGLTLAFVLALLLGVRRILRRLLPTDEDPRAPAGWAGRLGRAIRVWIERALPPGALLAGGSLLVLLFGLDRTGESLLLIFLWALFLQRLVLGGVTALLAPEGPSWRLLPASDGTAAYLSLWSQRFVLVWVWGEALAQAAEALALGADASALLSNLYRFILLLQALVLVSQQRDRVRSLLSAREPEDAAGAVRFAIAACNVVAARWHFVAIPYLIAFFAVWSTGSQVGLNYLLRATALTALVLAVAAALSRLVRLGTKRLFAVSERLKTLVPGIEERANRYTPVISGAMRALIWVGAFLFVLDAWGVPSLDILFSNAGIRFIGGLAGIAITLAVATGAIEACRAAIDHFLSGRRDARGEPILPTPQQRTLLPLGFSVVKWAAISIAGIIILDKLGVNIAPVLAGAGILGLAVGFGAQSLVKDIITGVFLLLENNIAVGDVVKVKDIGGLVEGFNLRSVRLRDYDGNVHVIPNGAIDVVTNYTKEYSRAVFDIGVAYRENVDEVIEVIRQVGEEMRAEPEWADAILEPVEIAGLDRFADSAVVIRGRFKTKPIKQWSVRREFFRRIKIAFDERGIEIPFPYRTLTWAEPKKTEPGPLPSARGERSENPSSPPPGPPRGASGSGRG